MKRQLWQVGGYDWAPARPDAFVSAGALPGRAFVAGAWVTSLEDIRVRFPGAEEPVKRWQGNLTPVVNYF